MNFERLQLLVQEGESEELELKRSTGQLDAAARTLCAFLNTRGGRVLIGVSPEGRILGQLVSDGTVQDLGNLLQGFEPAAPILISRVALPESCHEVVVLEAAFRPDQLPFAFHGKPFVRRGTTTAPMPQEQYQRLLLHRQHSRLRWENQPADLVRLEDLDQDEILRTLRRGIEVGRVPESSGSSVEEILDRLELRVRGELTNGAVVLFGRFEPGRGLIADYPQCLLRLARFRGRDKTEFIDQRQVHGHAFELLEEAMLFLRRHLPVAGRIQPGLFERVDEPLFPIAALREALVNALCHRDYGLPGGSLSVAVFDDRLEIWSDGTLPVGMTVGDLKREHVSRPRNPAIANAFYLRGLFERWGRGTQKIVELCVSAGHLEPEFLEAAGAVGVRFLPRGYVAPLRVNHDLTERQREILTRLATEGPLSLRQIWAGLGEPASRTPPYDLKKLRMLGLVESVGRGKAAMYHLRRGEEQGD
ncbi:MAG TPA: ATP-binding protein [Thermoanaerobaculia bacterium]|nr:ATP-binding protein [Thermoanaerobaculia bacterium]